MALDSVESTKSVTNSPDDPSFGQKVRQRFETDTAFQKELIERWFGDFFSRTIVNPETDEENIVFDPQALRGLFKTKRFEVKGLIISQFSVLKALQEKYKHVQFLTTEQVENQNFEARPLLYWPETIEEATSMMAIKNSDFNFLPSDLVNRSHLGDIELQSAEGEFSNKMSCLEAEFAVVLFHSKFGNASRDEKGGLIVRNTTGKYEKFNYKRHMEERGFRSRIFNEATDRSRSPRSIASGMRERLPHLYEAGLLKEYDIRELERRRYKETKSVLYKEVIGPGNITFNGVAHHIGRNYNKNNRPGIRAAKIAEDTALILDEAGNVEAYCSLYTQDDPGVKQSDTYQFNVGKSETHPQDIDFNTICPSRQGDESELEYAGRIKAIKSGITKFYIDVVSQLEDVKPFVRDMSGSELRGLAAIAFWIDKRGQSEDLQKFVQQFGEDGLRSFVQLGTKEQVAEELISYANENHEPLHKLFEQYTALLDYAAAAEQEVYKQTNCQGEECIALVHRVRENILHEAEQLLIGAVAKRNPGDLTSQLRQFSADARQYVGFLRVIGIERMFSNPLEQKASTELTDLEREQMRFLLKQNYDAIYSYAENENFKRVVSDSLENAFNHTGTDFYMLKDKERIVSFNRFDTAIDEVDGRKVVYFGSFNADPKYRGVGGIILKETIAAQLKDCDIMWAHCDPESDISKKYIEGGFVAKETDMVAGKFSFEIWQTKDIAEHLKTKQLSTTELLSKLGESTNENYFVREVEPEDRFLELDRGLGYLLTRYFTVGGKTYAAFEEGTPKLWQLMQPPRKVAIAAA